MRLYSGITRGNGNKPTKPEGKAVMAEYISLTPNPSKAKRGRPKTGFNKAVYMKEYMRKRRAKQNTEKKK